MRGQPGAWESLIFPLLRLCPTTLHNSGCEPKTQQLLQERSGQLMKAAACPHATSLAGSLNEIRASDQSLSFTCHIPEVKPCWRITGKCLPGSRHGWWVRLKISCPWAEQKQPIIQEQPGWTKWSLQVPSNWSILFYHNIHTPGTVAAHVQSRNNAEQLKRTFKINRGDNLFLLQKNERGMKIVTIYTALFFFFFNS